jgi:hypothetical protein
MLIMRKQGWLGWSYVVQNGTQQPVADLSVAVFGDSGSFSIQGTRYVVEHEGWLGRRFRLQRDGAIVARTSKGSAGHVFEIEAGEARYSLRQKSFASPEYVVLDGSRRVGSLLRPSYVRSAQVDACAEVPLPVQVFLLWLMALLWKWQVSP